MSRIGLVVCLGIIIKYLRFCSEFSNFVYSFNQSVYHGLSSTNHVYWCPCLMLWSFHFDISVELIELKFLVILPSGPERHPWKFQLDQFSHLGDFEVKTLAHWAWTLVNVVCWAPPFIMNYVSGGGGKTGLGGGKTLKKFSRFARI